MAWHRRVSRYFLSQKPSTKHGIFRHICNLIPSVALPSNCCSARTQAFHECRTAFFGCPWFREAQSHVQRELCTPGCAKRKKTNRCTTIDAPLYRSLVAREVNILQYPFENSGFQATWWACSRQWTAQYEALPKTIQHSLSK